MLECSILGVFAGERRPSPDESARSGVGLLVNTEIWDCYVPEALMRIIRFFFFLLYTRVCIC